jgi:hypothetical protein
VQTYLCDEQPFEADAVLKKDYAKIRPTVKSWGQMKRTDLLKATSHAVQVALQNTDLCAEIAGSRTMQKALEDFITDLPGDMGKAVKRLAKDNGAL